MPKDGREPNKRDWSGWNTDRRSTADPDPVNSHLTKAFMKKSLISLLAVTLLQATVRAQSPLVLVIDKDTRQIDWLPGYSIVNEGSLANNWFGAPLFPNVTITSPTLSYSGDGLHTQFSLQISGDRKQVEGISLGSTMPPLSRTVYSGTEEGPTAPTFSQGDFSMLSQLTVGEYTLAPFSAGWSGGIHVVVVPEPSTWLLLSLGLSAVASLRLRRSAKVP